MVVGGDADVNDLRAEGAEDVQLEDEEGRAGEGEGEDIELDEAEERAGDGGVAAENPAEGESDVDEEGSRVEPEAAHGPEGEGDGDGAEGEEAIDGPIGAGGVVEEGAQREEEGDGGEDKGVGGDFISRR